MTQQRVLRSTARAVHQESMRHSQGLCTAWSARKGASVLQQCVARTSCCSAAVWQRDLQFAIAVQQVLFHQEKGGGFVLLVLQASFLML